MAYPAGIALAATPQSQRRFSVECKPEAIEQVVKYQQRAVNVAQALGRRQLRKWIRSMKRE